ncbi:MAG: TOBE domain-containing protein, partial [Desulfobacterales bacterium]
LLCDEPTSSVDVENQITILNILRQINDEKKITILFTTHDSFQAASLADPILYLDQGRLTETPSENIFPAVMTRTQDHRGVLDIQGAIRLSIPLDMIRGEEEEIRLILHPEKLYLGAPDMDPGKGGAENQQVTGRVAQITDEKDKVRIIVDAGTRLTLRMPRDAYVKDRPLVGDRVSVLIPPEAVEVLYPS